MGEMIRDKYRGRGVGIVRTGWTGHARSALIPHCRDTRVSVTRQKPAVSHASSTKTATTIGPGAEIHRRRLQLPDRPTNNNPTVDHDEDHADRAIRLTAPKVRNWHIAPDRLGALIVGNGVVDGIRGTIAPAGNKKTPLGTQPSGVSSQYQLSSPSKAGRF